MLMAVTVIFVGCWLPLNVIHLTFDYYEKVRLTITTAAYMCVAFL